MSVFYQSKILQTPTEEMQDGGSVKPRKMFRGGVGGFELPENLQELIGYAAVHRPPIVRPLRASRRSQPINFLVVAS